MKRGPQFTIPQIHAIQKLLGPAAITRIRVKLSDWTDVDLEELADKASGLPRDTTRGYTTAYAIWDKLQIERARRVDAKKAAV